jgi:glycosyltransferase involved in cell wall biosynthesis
LSSALASIKPLKILFATGHGYLPQRVGGSETSSHELILALQEQGHRCAVLSHLQGNGWLAFRNRLAMKLSRRELIADRLPGYRVQRAWYPDRQVAAALARERPDVVLVQAGEPLRMAQALRAAGARAVVYLRDVEFHELGGDPAALPGQRYIANSRFVAEKFSAAYGPQPQVIRPLFRAERYATEREPQEVTFVNPHPLKGVDLAFAIAALCPAIPFCFVEGWPMSAEEKAALKARVAAHPNVRLQARTHDMRQVYRRSHTLLVPSQWEEAWGRVATEAQFSGIPVLASDRGGLPEAVGPGGRVLPHDAPASLWAAALREYWEDPAVYRAASEAALAHAERPEIDPTHQIAALAEILADCLQEEATEGVRPAVQEEERLSA